MIKSAKTTFIKFQIVNLIVSILIWMMFPLSIAGVNLAFPLFALKVITLLWLNDYPRDKSTFSILFFAFAFADIVTIFLFGSFSIYTWGLARLF